MDLRQLRDALSVPGLVPGDYDDGPVTVYRSDLGRAIPITGVRFDTETGAVEIVTTYPA